MSFVNVPEAPGSTGQNIESVIVTSSQHRQTFTVGSFNTTAMAPVTSSGGLLIHVTNPSTAVTVTNPSTAVSLSSAVALSSGTVTLSSVHTVTATAGTNPWSSAPGFNIPFVSASSGALQISGTPLVNIVGTSSGVAPVTTSGGLGVTILGGAAGGSTTVNLSSATALSSGTVTLSSVHTVTATAGTNPWSSAPGFNIPFVSASSGLLQISGTPLVNLVGTSSGIAPVTTSGGLGVTILAGTISASTAVSLSSTPLFNLVGTSSGIAPVTTSGGLGVTILGGAASGSTAVNIVGSSNGAAVVTTSGGLAVTIVSGGDLVAVVTTSGGFLTATTSYGLMVQSTQGTGPWSSAPGFNIPFVSASSGLLQISGTPLVNIVGTSSGVAPVTTSGGLGVTILGGAASGSTTVNLSSATALSSGIVTLSSVHTVTATAGTNPWSSAPGFNVPIVSASSGTIATVPSTAYPSLAFTFGCSSSASQTTVSTAPKMLTGWTVGSAVTVPVKLMFYNSTSITHGSTTNLILSVPIPGSTGLGTGSNLILPRPVEFDSRMSFVIFDDLNSTSTTLGTHGAGQIMGTIFVTSS